MNESEIAEINSRIFVARFSSAQITDILELIVNVGCDDETSRRKAMTRMSRAVIRRLRDGVKIDGEMNSMAFVHVIPGSRYWTTHAKQTSSMKMRIVDRATEDALAAWRSICHGLDVHSVEMESWLFKTIQ
jgi:hypothetical protein